MTRIPLTGGSYMARSLASSAQRCLNLYQEAPAPGEDTTINPHYYTPGLVLYANAPTAFSCRGMYIRGTADGDIIVVIGGNVYSFSINTSSLTLIGTMTGGSNPVSMMGAGTGYVVICDGSSNGWYVTPTNTLVKITDTAFFGSTTIVFLDTFLLFNKPGTNVWYSGPSNYAGNATPFDPLYVATKSTYLDTIAGLATVNQVVWVIGRQTTELWVDIGAADFPFQRVPEVLFQYGTAAPYSIATADGSVLFLAQDLQGRDIVMQGRGYNLQRVSQPALEWEWGNYVTTNDAVGMTYQQAGHTFYILTFPTADKTYVYDLSTQLWHERASVDSAGVEHQYRLNCVISVDQLQVFGGDTSNGNIYKLKLNDFTDNGVNIKRQRAFPHMTNDGNRVTYWRFMADMGRTVSVFTTTIALDWSDDRGATYGTPLTVPMEETDGGSLTWWRLGTARDRVFRLTWNLPQECMLQGAWIEATACDS